MHTFCMWFAKALESLTGREAFRSNRSRKGQPLCLSLSHSPRKRKRGRRLLKRSSSRLRSNELRGSFRRCLPVAERSSRSSSSATAGTPPPLSLSAWILCTVQTRICHLYTCVSRENSWLNASLDWETYRINWSDRSGFQYEDIDLKP